MRKNHRRRVLRDLHVLEFAKGGAEFHAGNLDVQQMLHSKLNEGLSGPSCCELKLPAEGINDHFPHVHLRCACVCISVFFSSCRAPLRR